MVTQEQKAEALDWEKLPEDVRKSIEKGIKQLNKGEGKPHTQLLEKYK